jgi:hypothetical protein
VASLALNIIGGLIVLAVSFFAGRIYEVIKRHSRFAHIGALAGGDSVITIVLPRYEPSRFEHSMLDNYPDNVAIMPVAEGEAVATIVRAAHSTRKGLEARLEACEDFTDKGLPFISIGNPTRNPVSARLVERYLHDYRSEYPMHSTHYGSMSFNPRLNRNGRLLEDYGFVLSGMTEAGSRFVILWGIWAPGAAIAAKTYENLKSQAREAFKRLTRGDSLFIIAHAEVDNYTIMDTHVMSWHKLP